MVNLIINFSDVNEGEHHFCHLILATCWFCKNRIKRELFKEFSYCSLLPLIIKRFLFNYLRRELPFLFMFINRHIIGNRILDAVKGRYTCDVHESCLIFKNPKSPCPSSQLNGVLACSRALRALHAWRASWNGELGVLQKISMLGVLYKMASLACFKTLACLTCFIKWRAWRASKNWLAWHAS